MSALSNALEKYVTIRRALGTQFREPARTLGHFVEFLDRGGRDLPECDIALGAVVGTIVADGQLAGIERSNIGYISTGSVLCHDDVCDVRTFAKSL